jgi:ABC-2 type transport system permease protein
MRSITRLAAVETKLLLRGPGWAFTIAIPLFFLLIFGVMPSDGEAGADAGPGGLELLASVTIAISLGLVALYMVPTTLAAYRERGVLRRLATTPVQPSALLGVQLVLHMVMVAVSTMLLIGIARAAFGISLPQHPFGFVAALAAGTLGLFSVGLLIAAVAPNGQAANGIGVLLYFPLAFLGGIMLPEEAMPETLAGIGTYTPLGALRQALQDAWAGAAPEPMLFAAMLGYAVVVGIAAARFFRWE